VVAPDVDAARTALDAAGLRVTGADGQALLVETDRPEEVTRVLGQAGVWLTELTPVRADLESVFLSLTAHDELGGGA
jgi:ABC-2 type transport system ATP-binding protein